MSLLEWRRWLKKDEHGGGAKLWPTPPKQPSESLRSISAHRNTVVEWAKWIDSPSSLQIALLRTARCHAPSPPPTQITQAVDAIGSLARENLHSPSRLIAVANASDAEAMR